MTCDKSLDLNKKPKYEKYGNNLQLKVSVSSRRGHCRRYSEEGCDRLETSTNSKGKILKSGVNSPRTTRTAQKILHISLQRGGVVVIENTEPEHKNQDPQKPLEHFSRVNFTLYHGHRLTVFIRLVVIKIFTCLGSLSAVLELRILKAGNLQNIFHLNKILSMCH